MERKRKRMKISKDSKQCTCCVAKARYEINTRWSGGLLYPLTEPMEKLSNVISYFCEEHLPQHMKRSIDENIERLKALDSNTVGSPDRGDK